MAEMKLTKDERNVLDYLTAATNPGEWTDAFPVAFGAGMSPMSAEFDRVMVRLADKGLLSYREKDGDVWLRATDKGRAAL